MDNFIANTFSIVIQPKQNFHFRYVSELRNTHGVLIGQPQQQSSQLSPNNVIEDPHPTIRLQLPAEGHLDEFGNKRDFFVLCSLHSYNTERGRETLSLSPHLLMEKANRTPQYDFVFKRMEESIENPLERSFQLKDFVIVRLKPDDYRLSLTKKRSEYEKLKLLMEFDHLMGDLNLDDPKSVKKSGILNVCLGFTIFERNFYTNEFRLYKETIYSNNIFHGDDLRIHELCNTKGSIEGGTKVHVLIKVQSGYNYFVRMFKNSSDMTTVEWEEFVEITNEDIFSNAAITFKLPAGPPNVNSDEIEVMIEIIVGQSTYKSKAVKFWYLNTNDNESGRRKRPRPIEAPSTSVQATEVATTSNVFDAIDPNLMHFSSPLQHIPVVADANLQEAISTYDENLPDQLLAFNSFDTETLLNNLNIQNVDNIILHTAQSFGDAQNDDTFIQYVIEQADSSNDSHTESGAQRPYYSEDRVETVSSSKEKIVTTNERATKISIDISVLIKNRIDQILTAKPTLDVNDINIKGLNDKGGNTIFHDAAMDMDTLIYLYRQQKKSLRLNKLIQKARNTYRQNLLHYACILNKANCIRPLVGMGIALNEQDSLGRTPLHIAIEHNYKDCLLKIQNLLEDHSKYPPEVENQLIKMFQVYSHKGHTVLHAAAIENLHDLVEVMLKFCKSHNFDILQYEALGNGDSIAHLIVKRNLVDMIALIRMYVPQYLTVQNYPGQTVLDIADLTTEMFEALKIN